MAEGYIVNCGGMVQAAGEASNATEANRLRANGNPTLFSAFLDRALTFFMEVYSKTSVHDFQEKCCQHFAQIVKTAMILLEFVVDVVIGGGAPPGSELKLRTRTQRIFRKFRVSRGGISNQSWRLGCRA